MLVLIYNVRTVHVLVAFTCVLSSAYKQGRRSWGLGVLHQTGFVGEGSDHLQLIKFWPSCVCVSPGALFRSKLLSNNSEGFKSRRLDLTDPDPDPDPPYSTTDLRH